MTKGRGEKARDDASHNEAVSREPMPNTARGKTQQGVVKDERA